MAINTPKAPNATNASGQVIAKPILQSSPTLRLANGDTAGANNRYWFPDYDFPNDKATTEMIVTVPRGWQALSNGRLVSYDENPGAGTAVNCTVCVAS